MSSNEDQKQEKKNRELSLLLEEIPQKTIPTILLRRLKELLKDIAFYYN